MEFQNSSVQGFSRHIEIPIRVRYGETDQMGIVHHTNYFGYFEVARMEQFRSWGYPYGQIENSGNRLMIIEMQCKCRAPAYFDELIFIKAWIHKMTSFRIIHHYEIKRENKEVIAIGTTALVSVSKEGFPIPLPKHLWNVWLTIQGHTV